MKENQVSRQDKNVEGESRAYSRAEEASVRRLRPLGFNSGYSGKNQNYVDGTHGGGCQGPREKEGVMGTWKRRNFRAVNLFWMIMRDETHPVHLSKPVECVP